MRRLMTVLAAALLACGASQEAQRAANGPAAPTSAEPTTKTSAAVIPSLAEQRAVIEANAPEMMPTEGGTVRWDRIERLSDAQRKVFAEYLEAIHPRLHAKFGDDALGALAAKPASDPLNDPKLEALVELVIDGATGELRKATVVRRSHVPAFDEIARAAVTAAAPFLPAPAQVRSQDGMVYVLWRMHRDEKKACQTTFAEGFILRP